ncbi:MAG TPA: hypothetical protein VKW06_17615 [Candidatus Angelobacter sp.]|nr:hypothetical protein [Candidatus Angelobacter sp.]
MKTRVLALSVLLVFFAPAVHGGKATSCPYTTLGSCPQIGCAKPNTPLAATNTLKRTTAINGSPAAIGFPDLQTLQNDVDSQFPVTVQGTSISSPRNMTGAARKIILSGLKTKSGKFSEGDYVELSGFIASTKLPPHPNTGESVNCGLKDPPSNDFHINITPTKNSEEGKGVVVEMIPQDPHRKAGWDLNKLVAIQQKQLPVKIRGRLFFDNEHVPNPDGTVGSNPRRFSVFEIHPLETFLVCPSGSCSQASDWKPLETWVP